MKNKLHMKRDSIRIKSSPDKEYNPFGIPAWVGYADDTRAARAPLWIQLTKERDQTFSAISRLEYLRLNAARHSQANVVSLISNGILLIEDNVN